MFRKRNRLFKNEVSAGSMADIAFLLLIFFLVTTTIKDDQGILVRLPIWIDEPIETKVNEENVFNVLINAENQVLVEGETVIMTELKEKVISFVQLKSSQASASDQKFKAIISLVSDRATKYDTYLMVYNEIKAAYAEMRNDFANNNYGMSFLDCDSQTQKIIKQKIPFVVSEAEPQNY